jgi:hypothetical protein
MEASTVVFGPVRGPAAFIVTLLLPLAVKVMSTYPSPATTRLWPSEELQVCVMGSPVMGLRRLVVT